jgi:hypothetical protein
MTQHRKEMEGMDRLFIVFCYIAIGAFIAVASVYFLHFARGSKGLSQNPADWAEFGEYLGGTLGGIFGLLAFIGILITIYQQRIQLELMRSQFNRDELQRLVASTWMGVTEVLNKTPSIVPPRIAHKLGAHGGHPTVHHILSAAGTSALRPKVSDYLIQASNDELMAQVTQSIGLDAGVLGIELDQMAECLIAYRLAGGSAEVEKIYKRRAGAYAAWLDAAGFPLSNGIKTYFDTAGRKASMVAEQAKTPASPQASS